MKQTIVYIHDFALQTTITSSKDHSAKWKSYFFNMWSCVQKTDYNWFSVIFDLVVQQDEFVNFTG